MDCKKAQSLVTAYIMRKLNDKDLEDFLEHVDSCEECYEELEIYYTVHYTIARLDEDEADQVYNVKKALQNRLEESRFYIWRTKVSRIYRIGLMVLAELLLVVILMTQADLWQNGTMEHNPICQFLSIHREDRRQAETEETLATRPEHEEVVHAICQELEQLSEAYFALSSESCAICSQCAYPESCRHPEHMIPCIESQGILVTDAAEKCGIEYFYDRHTVTWYGIIFFHHDQKSC